MKNTPLSLEINSPLELDMALNSLSKENGQSDHGVTLNLFGSQILVRQFDFPALPPRQIKNAVRLEATEAFSLLPEEIEVDYQILDSSEDKAKGVFMAIPRTLLKEYLSRLEQAKLSPAQITANILSRLNYFLKENKIQDKNFCVIDFYKEGVVNIAVFNNNKCQLLREINYENIIDAEKEISYSLKYASGRSTNKQFDLAFALGDISNKDGLIANLQKDFNTQIQHYAINAQLNNNSLALFFNLDLIKNNGIPQGLRKKLFFAANAALILSLLLFIFTGIKIIRHNIEIKNLSASFKAADYQYANELQHKLNSLKNVK